MNWAYLGIYGVVPSLRGPQEYSTAVESQYIYYEPRLLAIHAIIGILPATHIGVNDIGASIQVSFQAPKK